MTPLTLAFIAVAVLALLALVGLAAHVSEDGPPNRLTTLGFPVHTKQELGWLIREVERSGEAVGPYRVLRAGAIEVWVEKNAEDAVVDCVPYYQGPTRAQLRLDCPLDDLRAFTARTREGHPLTFVLPDYWLQREQPLPERAEVALTLFTYTLEPGTDRRTPPTPLNPTHPDHGVWLVGAVLEAGWHTNPLTRRRFGYACVDAGGVEVTLVFDPRVYARLPMRGDVVRASGALLGRVLAKPKPSPA